jgi:hypothetical protein
MLKIIFLTSLLQDFKSCLTKGYQKGILNSPSMKQTVGQVYTGKSLNYEYNYIDVYQGAYEQSAKLKSKYDFGNYSGKEKEVARIVLNTFVANDNHSGHKQLIAQSIIKAYLGWEDYYYGKNHHKENINKLFTEQSSTFYF